MHRSQSSSHNHHHGQSKEKDENDEDDSDSAALDIHHREDWIPIHASTGAARGREGVAGAAFSDGCLTSSTAFDLASLMPGFGYPCLPDEPQPPPLPLPISPPPPALNKEMGKSKGRVKKAGEGMTAGVATGVATGAATGAAASRVDRDFLPWPSAVKKRPRGSCEVCYQLKTQCDKTFPCGRCVLH